MRGILLRITFTISLITIVFLCCEFYIRQQVTSVEDLSRSEAGLHLDRDPRFLYEYTANGRRLLPNRDVIIHNHFISGLDVPVKTNSLGFRDDEIDIIPAADEIRILALGDSITISEYLPRPNIFADLVEDNLRKYFPGKVINLVNTGVGDIGLREEIDILEERGLALKPNYVLLNFYLNDSRPSWGFNDELAHRGWIRRNSLFINAIYHQFKLWGWAKDQGEDRFRWIPLKDKLNWKNSESDFLELSSAAAYDWGSAWKKDSWKVISEQLDRLDNLSKEHSFRIFLVVFPVSFQVYSDSPNTEPQSKLRQIAETRSYPYLDLLPVLRSSNGNGSLELFYDQCHPNELGHKIIAESIYSFLKNQLP